MSGVVWAAGTTAAPNTYAELTAYSKQVSKAVTHRIQQEKRTINLGDRELGLMNH